MIGLIDVDGKIPNLALMKLSTYYKKNGEKIEFVNSNNIDKYERIFASCLFTWNRDKCIELKRMLGDKITLGGTGWEFEEIKGRLKQTSRTILKKEIEECKPDYELYSSSMIYKRLRGISKKETKIKKAETIVNMGIGFTSRGCTKTCMFCVVAQKEGKLRVDTEIKDIINPKSNILTLLDNNITADPFFVEKFTEIKERKLIVDITQGIDLRLLNEKKVKLLSEVRHLRSIHYAWDLMHCEDDILKGIKLLLKKVKPYKHLCFILVGYNTTFEEDFYRFKKLSEMGVAPFVMIYNKNQRQDVKLKHFARWVNGRIYKSCKWEEYLPWRKIQKDKLIV